MGALQPCFRRSGTGSSKGMTRRLQPFSPRSGSAAVPVLGGSWWWLEPVGGVQAPGPPDWLLQESQNGICAREAPRRFLFTGKSESPGACHLGPLLHPPESGVEREPLVSLSPGSNARAPPGRAPLEPGPEEPGPLCFTGSQENGSREPCADARPAGVATGKQC